MAQQKKATTTTTHTKETATNTLFSKENYKWMLIGLVVMAIGFFLMAGGKSSDPNTFNDKEVYSTTRITIAPILIIAGLIIEIFAIMKKPK
jgi:FtsH-binding integral membrane protein